MIGAYVSRGHEPPQKMTSDLGGQAHLHRNAIPPPPNQEGGLKPQNDPPQTKTNSVALSPQANYTD
jgi:hypothetical protein